MPRHGSLEGCEATVTTRSQPPGLLTIGQPLGGSAHHRQTLTQQGLVLSMSRQGNGWDKVLAERFFHTLKTELTHHQRYPSREEAKQEIFEYIELFYNCQRRHSSLGYQTPVHYEAQNQKAASFCVRKTLATSKFDTLDPWISHSAHLLLISGIKGFIGLTEQL